MDGSLRKQEIHFQPCMELLATKHEGFLLTKEWNRMEQSHASFLLPDPALPNDVLVAKKRKDYTPQTLPC